MAFKNHNKTSATFSMSSMTDMIFMILLFFMIAATMSSPNDIKIKLPKSHSTTATKPIIVRIGISKEGEYSIAEQKEAARTVVFEEIEPLLQAQQQKDSSFYVALYADEDVPYKEIVKILDIVNSNKMKLVIATKAANN